MLVRTGLVTQIFLLLDVACDTITLLGSDSCCSKRGAFLLSPQFLPDQAQHHLQVLYLASAEQRRPCILL